MNNNYQDRVPGERDKWLSLLRDKPELQTLVEMVSADPDAIGILLDLIRTESGSLKFFCDKVIRTISESRPDLVYPWFEEIASLIHSPNHFIQWGALRTIANLISTDQGRKFAAIKNQYFDLIDDETMITAATVAGVAWKFVQALPELEPEITGRLLKAADNTYLTKGEPSPECRDIMIGHVLDSFEQYFDLSTRQAEMMAFAEGQIENQRTSTARKAISFIRKHSAMK